MKPRKPAAPGLRRGRKPAIAIPMPMHVRYAALHAMTWPELRDARQKDLSIELSRADRCAAVEPDRRKGAKGRRQAPALRNEIESIRIAQLYIWEAYKPREPGDRGGEKEAVHLMERDHHISRSALEKHLIAAKYKDKKKKDKYKARDETWWPNACHLACEGHHDKLMRFWPLHLRAAFT
jgi:hypothetical protein